MQMYNPPRKKDAGLYVPLLSSDPPMRSSQSVSSVSGRPLNTERQRAGGGPAVDQPGSSNSNNKDPNFYNGSVQSPSAVPTPGFPPLSSSGFPPPSGGGAPMGGGGGGSSRMLPGGGRLPSSSGGGLRRGVIAPGQPLPAGRQRDKFVPLPDDDSDQEAAAPFDGGSLPSQAQRPSPSLFEDLPAMPPGMLVPFLPPPPHDDGGSKRGRITFYCIGESFDRKALDELLRLTYPPGAVQSFPDVLHVEYTPGSGDQPGSDVFLLDYGVVACWGMSKTQEMTFVRGIARQCALQPLPDKEMEIDEFTFNYSTVEKPHVQNDTVTLHRRYAQSAKMKLAITYALAQSTKLSVYEKRVVDIVLETKNLPEALAEKGTIHLSTVEIAKLIGKVFLQKSAVNLLSSVLDTPEFFWHAPDVFQALYQRLSEYLELPARVELLNSRFSVLQELLEMLKNHQDNYHSVRLEWIVIWLIVVEVVVGCLELLGLFGLVGNESKAGRR